MAKFRITDSQTGKSVVVSGDSAPNDQEAEQIFSDAGLRTEATKPETAPDQATPKTSQALGFYQGLMKPVDNLATAMDTAAKHLGMPTDALAHALGLPTTPEAVKAHSDYVAGQQSQGIEPGGIGKFAGEVVGTAPVLAATANPIVAGAASSALLTDKKDLAGVAEDAALGGVAGKVGDVVLKGAARVVSPVVNATAKKLLGEGIQLTPGQIMGGIAKRTEDAITSVPIVGDAIRGAQRRSLESFNRAAINRTLKPLGTALPDTVSIGYDAINHAGNTLDAAYNAILPNLTVKADGKFAFEAAKLKSLAQNLAPDAAAQVNSNIDTVINSFSPGAQAMSGETMKGLYSELGRVSRAYRSSASGPERLVGDALTELQSILRGAVERSNPAQAAALKAVDRGYANLLRIESAASKAKDGIFTPAQLQTATRVMDSSLRKRASARGSALLQDLAVAARDRLPNSVPDSGTPERLMRNALIGGGAAYIEPTAAAAGLGAAAAYSKPGVNALRILMTQRPQGAEEVANYLRRLSGPAGVAGATALSGATE